MNEFLLIFGMTAVTFGVRYPVLAIVGKINLPEPVFRALKYVPVAVLTAIVFPEVLMPDETLNLSPDNSYMIGAIVAVLVAWRTRSLLWTIVTGMAVFLAWRGLIGA